MKGNISRKNHRDGLATRIARHLLIIACALTLFVVVTQSFAAEGDHDIGDIGGEGGAPFRSKCRATQGPVIDHDDVIIGFNMRSGTALDAIVPICIALNKQGTEWSGVAYEPTPYIGGPGGGYQKIACQPGYAVRHFHVYAGPWGDNNMVKHVRMTCQELKSDHWYNVVPEHTAGTVTGDQRYSCGNNEWGSGIYGKAGSLIDRLGFTCRFHPPW